MKRDFIKNLDLLVENVYGEKEGKEYDFISIKVVLQDKEFTLYPREKDRQLFNYLLDKEINENN